MSKVLRGTKYVTKQRVDELLTCSVCGGQRTLDGSRTWGDGFERHTFRCPDCGKTDSYKNEEIPPFMVGVKWGDQLPSVACIKKTCVYCGCDVALSVRTIKQADCCLITCVDCITISSDTFLPETVREVKEFFELDKHR